MTKKACLDHEKKCNWNPDNKACHTCGKRETVETEEHMVFLISSKKSNNIGKSAPWKSARKQWRSRTQRNPIVKATDMQMGIWYMIRGYALAVKSVMRLIMTVIIIARTAGSAWICRESDKFKTWRMHNGNKRGNTARTGRVD